MMSPAQARDRALELLVHGGAAGPAQGVQLLPAPALGRSAAARDDRAVAVQRPGAAHRRRADDRARRHGAGRDPRPDAQPARPPALRGHPHHARHGRGRGPVGPDRGHASRAHRRDGHRARDLQQPAAPVHPGAAGRGPAPRCGRLDGRGDRPHGGPRGSDRQGGRRRGRPEELARREAANKRALEIAERAQRAREVEGDRPDPRARGRGHRVPQAGPHAGVPRGRGRQPRSSARARSSGSSASRAPARPRSDVPPSGCCRWSRARSRWPASS